MSSIRLLKSATFINHPLSPFVVAILLCPSDCLNVIRDSNTSSENDDYSVVMFACSEHQPIRVDCYRRKDKDGDAVLEEVSSDMHYYGKNRSLRLSFTRRQQSGTYEVIIETLPYPQTMNVLNRSTITLSFKVKVQGQLPLINYNM